MESYCQASLEAWVLFTDVPIPVLLFSLGKQLKKHGAIPSPPVVTHVTSIPVPTCHPTAADSAQP